MSLVFFSSQLKLRMSTVVSDACNSIAAFEMIWRKISGVDYYGYVFQTLLKSEKSKYHFLLLFTTKVLPQIQCNFKYSFLFLVYHIRIMTLLPISCLCILI